MSKIRVFIADDHAILRAGLRLLIEHQADMRVVGEAGTLAETLKLARTLEVDVLTLDLAMPDVAGMSGIHRVRSSLPKVRILVLTMHDDPAYLQAALGAGAGGYLVKKAADAELLGAIRAVHQGRTFVDVESASKASTEQAGPGIEALSPRERLVIEQVAQGMTNQQIADKLDVSVKTIESYRARLMKKLGLKSRADIYQFAMLSGLLNTPLVGPPANQPASE